MTRRQELYKRRADLMTEAQGLLDKARTEKRDPTAEETTRFDAIRVELEGPIKAGIEREDFLAEQLRNSGDPNAATGSTIEVGEDLRARAPWGPDLARIPATALDERRRAMLSGFGEFSRAVHGVASGSPRDPRLGVVQAAASGSNEGVGSEGAFLVPPEYSNIIWNRMSQSQDNLLNRCDQYTVTGESLTFNANAENSRAIGSLYGGVRGYWMAEAAQHTSVKPAWRQVKVAPWKLGVFIFATDELLEDSTLALGQYFERAASESIMQLINSAIISGNGSGQPLGLLNSGALVTVAKETSQANTTIIQENISKMWARLHPNARANSIWLHNVDVEPQLDALSTVVKNVAGTENVGGYANKVWDPERRTLKGRPLVPCEFCETLGTKGDLILTDLSYYIAGLKGGIKSASSIHLRFDYGEQCFRWTFRVDGRPWLLSPITPAKGSNTLSTIVALASRP